MDKKKPLTDVSKTQAKTTVVALVKGAQKEIP